VVTEPEAVDKFYDGGCTEPETVDKIHEEGAQTLRLSTHFTRRAHRA